MKKIMFCLSLGLLSIGTCFGAPQVRISTSSWYYPTVSQGTTLKYAIDFYNAGDTLLTVRSRTDCECIFITPEQQTLEPNQKKRFNIKFKTKEYSGDIFKYLYFQTDDPDNPNITVPVMGTIIPKDNKPVLPSVTKQAVLLNKPIKHYATTDYIQTIPAEPGTLHITLFSSLTCAECEKIKTKLVPELQKTVSSKIVIDEYPLDDAQNYEHLINMEKKFSPDNELRKMPVLFVISESRVTILGGAKQINNMLGSAINEHLKLGNNKKVVLPAGTSAETKGFIISKFGKFSLTVILVAGLIDGINPCAFATLIFFITYLSMMLKKTRTQIMVVSISFIAGVYVTYFLLGIGILKFVSMVSGIYLISKIMYFVFGMFTLTLAVLYFYDSFTIKKIEDSGGAEGTDKKVLTALPTFFRWKMYDVITKFTQHKWFFAVVFLVGVLISILELFCTGQIFLPTLMYMTTLPDYRVTAVAYLLLYSFMFVAPLIVIFLLYYFGSELEIIEHTFRKYIFIIKILTAFLFLGLAIFMFISI
jgi:cytochrome c biogenesis protein CcdA